MSNVKSITLRITLKQADGTESSISVTADYANEQDSTVTCREESADKDQESPASLPPPIAENSCKTKQMKKPYTEQEKAKIAEDYKNGVPVTRIAASVGRRPESIYKIVNAMGIRRNNANHDPKEEKLPKAAPKTGPLKKPWYLQKQLPNNRERVTHE